MKEDAKKLMNVMLEQAKINPYEPITEGHRIFIKNTLVPKLQNTLEAAKLVGLKTTYIGFEGEISYELQQEAINMLKAL